MLGERFIVVIDDELAIQDAMRAVLTAWGHSVVVAGSSEEMLERVAERSARPDLVICDLRLRGDENGLDAIERLRSKFHEKIPAILITGDTESDRLKRAAQSDCFVMHKPVSNSRLRAAISNLTMSEASLQA
jgi:CheY-like chemotaxis protein